MKRTNVVLDEDLLAQARRVSGEPTYSRTIERALREMVRREQARSIDTLAGSGLWVGNLADMRGDSAPQAVRESASIYRARRKRGTR
jgi:hypothetical protein